jgi:EAL domain-containing protein (putative c-di-GMP-specific phosphodiesterase class I)
MGAGAGMLRPTRRHAIVASIIQLAHGLGMTVVAEGVETAEQHHTLVKLDADACQGFCFARPMPALAINAFVLPSANGESTIPYLP